MNIAHPPARYDSSVPSFLSPEDRATRSDSDGLPFAATTPFIVDYWRLIAREKYKLILPALILAAVFILAALQMTPAYRTFATVVFEGGQRRPVSFEDVYRGLTSEQGQHSTQAEFLQTKDVALRVIRKLKLEDLPEFRPSPGLLVDNRLFSQAKQWLSRFSTDRGPDSPARSGEDFALEQFRARLTVDRLSQTELFKVTFESADPAVAAAVANQVVAAYIRADMDARYDATKEARIWLADRLAELEQALDRSEKALLDYRQRNGLLARNSDVTTERQIAEITQRLIDARGRRIALEESYAQASNRDLTTAVATPAIAANPMVLRAREAEVTVEKRLAELGNQLGSAHPQYRAANSELQVARETLRQEITGAVRTIGRELAAARAAEKQMESELRNARSAGQNLDRKEIELNQLEREVNINRQLYETFLARNKEVAAASDFQQPAARLVDPALVPTSSTRAPLALIGLFGGSVGGLFGLLIVLIRDRLRNTLRTTEDVESRLGEPLLAAVPKLKPSETARAANHVVRKPESLYSEAIRTAATGVALASLDGVNSVIAVSSALDNEGKTTVACNLALALSTTRRVLLIDADLHRPSVCSSLGLQASHPGLSQLLAGRAGVEECLQVVAGTALTVIPAGKVPGNALDLLMTRRLQDLVSDLQNRFDLIILDTPPTQLVSDTLMLSRVASGMIMVARSDRTPLPVIRRALRRARATRTSILGIVLNAHDFLRADRYYGESSGYGKFGYRHGYGYGFEEPRKSKAKRSRGEVTPIS